jgi:SAM-dependent methyltransferase
VKHLGNVEVRRGLIEDLPIDDGWADAVLLSLSLGHTPDPGAAVARCVRALRPGGRLIICDVESHGDATLVRHLGDGFAGFEPGRLEQILRAAGLGGVRRVQLPADAATNGTEQNNGHRGGRPSRARGTQVLAPLFMVGTRVVDTRPRRDRSKIR